MKGTLDLTVIRLKLLARNRVTFFFSVVFPVGLLFIYGFLFGKADPAKVRFLMAPVVVLTILGSGFWGVGFQIVIFREKNILRRFRPAPIGASPLLISGVLANWALQVFVVSLEFALGRAVFHVPWPPHPLELFLVGTLGLFAFAGIGAVVASVANTSQETQVLCNLLWFGFMFLSGATAPFAQLPEVVRHIALFLPSFYLVYAIQALMLGGAHLSAMLPEIAALVATSAAAFLLSLKLFRWDTQMKLPWSSKAWALPAAAPFLVLGLWANLFSHRISQALALYSQVWPR